MCRPGLSCVMSSVSVIVPSRDSGRFIAEALDSILGQTVAPEQIIIVDDGSTDDTEQVVRRYADPRVDYIKQSRTGIAAARNAGLNAARGEFVSFLDADDRWKPHFIERMHGFLAEDPTVVCAFANFIRFQHPTGEVLRDQFQSYPELRRPVLLRDAPNAFGRIPKERAFDALVTCAEIPAYTQVMMFRRAAIASIRFESTLATGKDINFALKTFMQGGVIFTDEVLGEVRVHDRDPKPTAAQELDELKSLAPHVARDVDVTAYQARLVQAHLDAALYETKSGRVRAGLQQYRDGLRVPGSRLRKLEGSLRLAWSIPKALVHFP
jgi:hypothetical protein